MKITIRLIVSLVLIIALVAIGFSFYQVRAEKTRLTSELERWAGELIAALARLRISETPEQEKV